MTLNLKKATNLYFKENEMRYTVDHDFHIHSHLSICSSLPEQTKENILKYAEENELTKIVLTDHFWDEEIPFDLPPLEDGRAPKGINSYTRQSYTHIRESIPLPQGKNTKFLFGGETEMTHRLVIGLGKRPLSELDFIIVPTTHMHITGFTITEADARHPETRARVWVDRFRTLLSAKLPFHKMGVAHLVSHLIAPTREEFLEVLRLLPENELRTLFRRAAELGLGIELNRNDFNYENCEADTILRPFLIAKSEGCKFYLGSDSHNPDGFKNAISRFNKAIDELSLKETDKFII